MPTNLENKIIEVGFLHLPDGKIISYGANTMSKSGFDCSNIFIDEVMFTRYEDVEARVRYLKIRPGDIFIDVGACIGSWSVYAAIYGANIHAIDVGEKQLNILFENAKLNNIADKITFYRVALVGDSTRAFVYDEKMNVYEKPNDFLDHKTVPAITMDRWTELFKDRLPHIDYIKIDVEGMEFDVLKGAVNTIKQFKPKLIIEIHEADNIYIRKNIENLLKDLDYKHEHILGLNDYFYPQE